MILSFLAFFISSSFDTRKRIEVTVSSDLFETLPIEDAVFYVNEFYQDGCECVSNTINSLENVPETVNDTLNAFSSCFSPFQLDFLNYLHQKHYFAPRAHFYTSIQDDNDNKRYEFEPEKQCFQFVDLSRRPYKLNNSCVIRPIISNKENRKKALLNGYGVELRPFKYSMEYNVKDNNDYNPRQPTFDDDSRKYLDTLKNFLDGPIPSAKRLRRAFFSYVNEIDEEMRITALKETAANWPAAASYVSLAEVDKEIEEQIKEEYEDGSVGINPGSNLFLLNGRVIPINTMDPFTLISTIGEEMSIIHALDKGFDMAAPSIELLQRTKITKPNLFVDIRHLPIHWVNDIEKDKRYKKWSSNINSFLESQSKDPHIRKNVVNLVLVIDPAYPRDFGSMISAFKLIQHKKAIRIGLLISPHIENENSLQIARAFEEIAADSNSNTSFWRLLENLKTDVEMSVTSFSQAYEKLTNKKWNEFSDESLNKVKENLQKLNKAGLQAPSVWINGIVYGGSESLEYIEVLADEAMNTVRNLIPYDFNGDILDLILTRFKAVSRIIPEIHTQSPVAIKVTKYSGKESENLIKFIQRIKYELIDSEFPLISVIVVTKQNSRKGETIVSNIKKFFESPHKIPVRIAFIHQIPSEIKPEKDFPNLFYEYSEHPNSFITKSEENNDEAILIVNGRILSIDENFDGFNELFEWQAFSELAPIVRSIQFKNPVSNEKIDRLRYDIHFFWSMCLLSYSSLGVTRKELHPNTFDPASPAVIEGGNFELSSSLSIEAILNPFSKEFQKCIAIIDELVHFNVVCASVRLNPPQILNQIPSSFYRYVSNEAAVFSYLDNNITYSIIPEPPETWLMEQEVSDVDIDNIFVGELNDGAYRISLKLANIVIEGKAIDNKGNNCDGAQLNLLSNNGSHISDTIVMRNKGYWQLKAPFGKYTVTSSNFKISSLTQELIVASFVWSQNTLKLERYNCTENINKFSAIDDGKIHIFVVASGRLYERLARIMMVSVVKNTAKTTKCKFWLFQSFLSPHFRLTLEKMKDVYNIEYELIAYRWPYWLRRQTEKQRITWGNKILFLDVLFPLSLQRVIYVDADQTIRTDMRELMTMNFEGAPYAFTPFCDSREEIEPYRFWKSGFWHDHLKGKKYHISALFAVDLTRFRELSAGDWLRYYYSQLVDDPSSLANLDQDLPNYAQERIPIFSLPQEWLWCETWCSDDSMKSAKIIDLCNNPMTKRPKLEIAQTRIKEWPELDKEVRDIELNINISFASKGNDEL